MQSTEGPARCCRGDGNKEGGCAPGRGEDLGATPERGVGKEGRGGGGGHGEEDVESSG